MGLKILIADDDPATAAYLKKVIEEVPGLAVVSIAGDGEETIRQVEVYRPDVVFLDIDMPGINGLDAARELAEMRPGLFLVFATAYPEFALEAFELYSFDYILKPFDEVRIRRTVRRLRDRVCKTQDRRNELILIKSDKRKLVIHPEEILFIESRRHKILIKSVRAAKSSGCAAICSVWEDQAGKLFSVFNAICNTSFREVRICSKQLRQIFCDLHQPCSCSWRQQELAPPVGFTGISRKYQNKDNR